ncbi:MAG: GTPase [Acidimicrobiia bacterium]
MSRRRSRLHNDLALLAGELETLAPITSESLEIEAMRLVALQTLRDFLLPRLALSQPPVLVALVGSTGAGKSTLLNSIAGEVISPVGALRPTTKVSRYWSSKDNALSLTPNSNHVEIGTHPLLQTMVLVDTPDLDSDVVEHRTEALAVADRADAILFVTTANRYGDAIVWTTLTSLAANRPVAVVLNRTPSRATGARNDLQARLRRAGLSDVSLFTISEQRIESARQRLSPQALQRVSAYLRGLSPTAARLERAAETIVDALTGLLDWLGDWNQEQTARAAAIEAKARRVQAEVDQFSLKRRRWRRDRPLPAEIEAWVDNLAEERVSIRQPVPLDRLRHGWQVLVDADFDGTWSD